MPDTSNYQLKIDMIRSVDDKHVKPPKMPVADFIQESNNLFMWCKGDRAILESKGLDWSLVEELPEYISILIEIQSKWNAEKIEENETVREWKEKLALAKQLHKTLLQDFRFAFRNNTEILKHLPQAKHKRNNSRLIQDLNDLALFGKAHIDELSAIRFDRKLPDMAINTANELASLQAEVHTLRHGQSELMILRNKTYTLCKNQVDTIREKGRYALWNNRERRIGYISEYHAKWTSQSKKESKKG